MASHRFKIFGQSAPLAGVDTLLYTVPPAKMVATASFCIANRGATADVFYIALIKGGGGTILDEHYIYYDIQIDDRDAFNATIGTGLEEGDEIWVRSTNGDCSFTVSGDEMVDTL